MSQTKSTHGKKLFFMMVLELFIWAAWLPLIFSYLPSLGFTPGQQTWILNAFPIAAIVGMFFSNQFADRYFAAEKFLAFSHVVSGIAILACGFTREFWPFFIAMMIHCLFYVPTISICNSIAFTHMKDAQREFGIVRMGGTVGWIMAAWPFTFIFVDWNAVASANPVGISQWFEAVFSNALSGEALTEATKWTFIVSAIASFLMAAYSLTLPHTPAKKVEKSSSKGSNSPAWLESVKLLKIPFIGVLFFVTFIDAFVHNAFYNWAGTFFGTAVEQGGAGIKSIWIMPVMSLGQVAEIGTMMILGYVLKKLGWKLTLMIGVFGHAIRFSVFAFMPESQAFVIAVNLVHGICYAFFFATVYIFVDAYFPKDARTSAQGLFNVMILGLGVLVANTLCPFMLQEWFTHEGVTNFKSLFLVPTFCSILGTVLLGLLFDPPKQVDPPAVEAH